MIQLDISSELVESMREMVRAILATAGPCKITSHGRTIHFDRPGLRSRLLSALADPNLAYILLMIGLAGLYFELSHAAGPSCRGWWREASACSWPSSPYPHLPVSYAGLGLILLAVALFIAEIKIASPTACSPWARRRPWCWVR